MVTDQVEIAQLRQAIDETDARILAAITERLEIGRRIGILKSRTGTPVMQSARVDEVLDRARAHARANGQDPEFLASLFHLLIDEVSRQQRELITEAH